MRSYIFIYFDLTFCAKYHIVHISIGTQPQSTVYIFNIRGWCMYCRFSLSRTEKYKRKYPSHLLFCLCAAFIVCYFLICLILYVLILINCVYRIKSVRKVCRIVDSSKQLLIYQKILNNNSEKYKKKLCGTSVFEIKKRFNFMIEFENDNNI